MSQSAELHQEAERLADLIDDSPSHDKPRLEGELFRVEERLKATEHPLVTGVRKRLDSINARAAPGMPLHYNLEKHRCVCSGCGDVNEFTILLTVRRAQGAGKAYSRTAPNEPIYDLPVDEGTAHFSTPRCEKCFDLLPRLEAPPMPPMAEKLRRRKPEEEIDLVALGLM